MALQMLDGIQAFFFPCPSHQQRLCQTSPLYIHTVQTKRSDFFYFRVPSWTEGPYVFAYRGIFFLRGGSEMLMVAPCQMEIQLQY